MDRCRYPGIGLKDLMLLFPASDSWDHPPGSLSPEKSGQFMSYWSLVTPHLCIYPVRSTLSLSPICFFPQIFGAIEEESPLGFPVGGPGTNLNVSRAH
jgi:hypothetical protein